QLQPGSQTIQKVLDESLSTILSEKIVSTGAGRTDAGVHALFFCAHFDSRHSDLDKRKNLINRLNRYLPGDIAVQEIRKVKNYAHARFSAVSRTYRYFIIKSKDPFRRETSWHVSWQLDMETMKRAGIILTKHADFTSFSRLHSNAKTNFCTIFQAEWEECGELIIFSIKADRFLRNMVRAIVGNMVDLVNLKLSLDDFEKIIMAKDRCKASKSAPAQGLFLTSIEYPEEIFF
ncbi:MAG: tRNA pseudouridine(38-40) synthase TruA, partial [Bacteroidales bacterium]